MDEHNTLRNRRGKVVLSRQFICEDPSVDYLKPIFENFYPMAIEPNHTYGIFSAITYFGLSPFFREIEEGDVTPEYEAIMQWNGEGICQFIEFNEVK